MTSPKHAHDTDHGRYYLRPGDGKQLVSVTNALATGVSKPALVPWAAKITASKALDSLPFLLAATRLADCGASKVADECTRCTPCVVKTIKREVTVARDKAGDLGTRIHAHADAHVTGAQVEPDPEVAPYLAQYERFLADYDIDLARDVEAAELTVADPKAGYAGTLDLLVRLPLDGYLPGQAVKTVQDPAQRGLWLVDIKTSATRGAASVYAEYALQLAALRTAKEAWLPDDSIIPMPKPIVGAAVLNLRQRDHALIPVPTGQPERTAFLGALATTRWLHETGRGIDKGEYRPILPSGRPKPKRGQTKTSKSTTTPGEAA